jgi:hypothetical protein
MAEHTGQSSQLFPITTGRNAQFLATVARSRRVRAMRGERVGYNHHHGKKLGSASHCEHKSPTASKLSASSITPTSESRGAISEFRWIQGNDRSSSGRSRCDKSYEQEKHRPRLSVPLTDNYASLYGFTIIFRMWIVWYFYGRPKRFISFTIIATN